MMVIRCYKLDHRLYGMIWDNIRDKWDSDYPKGIYRADYPQIQPNMSGECCILGE